MKFKNLSRLQISRNIVKVWNIAEDRTDWYKTANDLAGDDNKTIGYIASLSPLKRWEQNIKLAMDFKAGKKVGHMSNLVKKCEQIRLSDGSDAEILRILNGSKICSFYLNIKYYNEVKAVTIDRHAISIAIGKRVDIGITSKEYQFLEQCYLWTAAKLKVNPLILQSATWVAWRKIK